MLAGRKGIVGIEFVEARDDLGHLAVVVGILVEARVEVEEVLVHATAVD